VSHGTGSSLSIAACNIISDYRCRYDTARSIQLGPGRRLNPFGLGTHVQTPVLAPVIDDTIKFPVEP